MGEKATYNLDTKASSAERYGQHLPLSLFRENVTSDSDEEYAIRNGSFTTDDS
jgi:hypothetical protein